MIAPTVVILIVVMTVVATILHREWGLTIVFAEMMIGSFGRWIDVPLPIEFLSIRMVIFSAFICAWIFTLRKKSWGFANKQSLKRRIKPWMIIGIITAVYGVVRGLALKVPLPDVADDANQWLFFILLVPLALADPKRINRILEQLWPAASIALFIVSATLLYVFTHDKDLGIAMAIYRWTRDTLVAEVTVLTPSVVRVFLQSHVIILPVLWALLLSRRATVPSWLLRGVMLSIVLMSLSRSLVVGLVGAIVIAMMWYRDRIVIVRNLFVGTIIALLMLITIVRFPLVSVGNGSIAQGLIERTTLDDAASRSRWALLAPLGQAIARHPLLGSGLGASIEYKSQDPRVLETNPNGWFKTHAFEWGVLDLWYKFGLLGLLLYGSILWQSYRYAREEKPRAALSVLTLAFIHIFTPYLNHPIGLMMLFGIDQLAQNDDLFAHSSFLTSTAEGL